MCDVVCVCGQFSNSCACARVSVQCSHPVHIAPGLYPSNCRSQSDIVLLWLLSMVLHISPEMTKSLSQCPWPPASLLVLLHSYSLMWPWIGIGHQPHSRDWYCLCCSQPTGLQSSVVSLGLSDCLSVSSLQHQNGWHYKCNNLEKRSLSSYIWVRTRKQTKQKNSSSFTKCHEKMSCCCPPTSLQIKALILLHEEKIIHPANETHWLLKRN